MPDLDEYFAIERYEVVAFESSSNHTMRTAADRLGIPKEGRRGTQEFAPYRELKDGAPEIYSHPEADPLWITLDVKAHDVDQLIPGRPPGLPWVLLWLRDDAPPGPAEVRRRTARAVRNRPVVEASLGGADLLAHLSPLAGLRLTGPHFEAVEVLSVEDMTLTLAVDGEPVTLAVNEVAEALPEAVDGLVSGQAPQAVALAAVIGTLPGADWDDDTVSLGYPDVPVHLPDGPLDRMVAVRSRVEQRTARRVLFGGRGLGRCALCGHRFTVDLLVAAHIKPRWACDEQQRRDLPFVLMAACLLGCDALYERGLMAVDADGGILLSDMVVGATAERVLAERFSGLAGRRCETFNDSSATYFAWHHKHVFRRL